MPKQAKESAERAGQTIRGPLMTYGGIALIVAGILMVRRASGNDALSLAWLWWLGVCAAVLGAHLWLFSGMSREQILEWMKSEAFALGVALCIRWSFAEPYRIPSGSMEPTLMGDPKIGRGDRVFVNKWIYGVRVPFMNKRLWYGQAPERWDIVVFKSAEEKPTHSTLVKRVVGLPGEHIQIHSGKVHADGVALELPASMPEIRYTSGRPMRYGVLPDKAYSTVPEGHYLVMGDNSANSRDGRYFGWLPNENIVGRVACIWWWPHHWRDFTGFTKTWWWRTLLVLLGLLCAVRLIAGRSWAVPSAKGRGMDHYYVSFIRYGLRLPFTLRWLGRRAEPKRGELVMYYPVSEELPKGTVLLGRVGGLPGEAVSFKEGQFEVDSKTIDTPPYDTTRYDNSTPEAQFGVAKGKAKRNVPEGHYFLLADEAIADEEGEIDSRHVGWIPRDRIAGKAAFLWWPPTRWRKIH